jgi:hypothetical protein
MSLSEQCPIYGMIESPRVNLLTLVAPFIGYGGVAAAV